MTQSINVSPNQTYRLRFWAKGTGLSSNAVKVGLVDPEKVEIGQFIELPAGQFEWQPFEVEIETSESQLPVSVIATGGGMLSLDNFQIEWVEQK